MDSNGRCKIIDYGLAKKVRMWHSTHYHNAEQVPPNMNAEDVTELLSGSVGTKIFSSPEQASSEKYDHRTDIYSLAMVIIILFSDFTTAHEERELLY